MIESSIVPGFATIAVMTDIQNWLVVLMGACGLLAALYGLYQSARRNNVFGETPGMWWLGIFVWGDALVFGLFWFLVSIAIWFLQDWLLFILVISIFWLVRSVGETIYWFLQQFSTITRNEPKNLIGYRLVKNDAIWFINQIFWQCITVVTAITSLYVAKLWLG